MKERLDHPAITKAISSYVGVDWLALKAAKESGRYKQGVHSLTLMPDKLARRANHIHEK